jgi:hypothetical protein
MQNYHFTNSTQFQQTKTRGFPISKVQNIICPLLEVYKGTEKPKIPNFFFFFL